MKKIPIIISKEEVKKLKSEIKNLKIANKKLTMQLKLAIKQLHSRMDSQDRQISYLYSKGCPLGPY